MKNSPRNMANSNWLSPFQNLSKIQKTILVTLVIVLIFGGGFLLYKFNSMTKQANLTDQSKNISTDQKEVNQTSNNPTTLKTSKVTVQDYPSMLSNHKSTPKIGFNLALNQNESNAVYGYDRKLKVTKKLYNYLQLPYRATNTSTKVSNNFILQTFQLDAESDQTLTHTSWTYFDDQKQANQMDYLGEIPLAYTSSGKSLDSDQSKSIPQNVIWYGLTSNSPENLPTKDSEYGKAEYINQGVYIYTRSLKNDVGTYLKDLKNDIEFKISDQYCSYIFYSKTDFWCLNSQRKLINLSDDIDYGEYSKIVSTDRGIVFAVRNVDDLYSAVDQITFDDTGKLNIIPNIFQTKQGEIVTFITFTNQQELLIQINRSQSVEFQESIKNGEKINELYTTELQDKNGQIDPIPRPEFDQFTVIF